MAVFDEVVTYLAKIDSSWATAQSKANAMEAKINTTVAAIDTAIASGYEMTAQDVTTNVVVTEPTNPVPNTAPTMTASSVSTSVSVDEPTNPVPNTAPTMTGTTVSTDVSVAEPNVTIPAAVDASDLTFLNNLRVDSFDDLTTRMTTYIATYFPTDGVTNSAMEAVIQDLLAGQSGVDAGVEAQIYERDRTRINEESLQAQDTVVAQFAAKRFPLPPGAAAHAVMLIQQKAQDELGKSSREVAIKAFDVAIQNVRAGVEAALKARQNAMSTAIEYIKGLTQSITVSSQVAFMQAEAQTKLISAAADFYRARQGAKELLLKKDMTNAGYTLDTNKANLSAELDTTKTNVQALATTAPLLQARVAVAELGLKKDMTNAGFTMDAEKANLSAELDVIKTNVQALATTAPLLQARVSAKELELKRDMADAQFAQEAAKENLHADLQLVGEKVKALLAATDSLARMAAAFANNLHGSVGASVSASNNNSVGYSYSNDTASAAPVMTSV